MVHSLPRTRAQALRTPMMGLPTLASHAPEGSSARTQVIERLIVPCAGIGSTGLFTLQPAAPAAAQNTIAGNSAFLIILIRFSPFLVVAPYLPRRLSAAGRTALGSKSGAGRSGVHYCPFRSDERLVPGVVELAGEAVQRLVAQDVDRGTVVLVARRLHVDGAVVAPKPGAGEPLSDERLAQVLVAGLGRVVDEHPGDRAADRALLRDRRDLLGGRAARDPQKEGAQ